MVGEPGLATATIPSRRLDDLSRETEAPGDFEREAASRRAVAECVGGREGVGIEPERGAADTVGRRGERLEGIVVARDDDPRAALAKMFDDCRTEGAALDRIRAGPDLVQQHQGRVGQFAIHRDDLGNVAREGAETGRDRLVVADVREDRPEHRQPRSLGHGNMQPGLGHQRQEPGGLEGHGLATGIRSGHDQRRDRRRQQEIDRDRFGRARYGRLVGRRSVELHLHLRVQALGDAAHQEGMAGVTEFELSNR